MRISSNKIHNVLMESIRNVIGEDVLGDNWTEAQPNDDSEFDVGDNYDPFEDQKEDHDWSIKGENELDPTVYE